MNNFHKTLVMANYIESSSRVCVHIDDRGYSAENFWYCRLWNVFTCGSAAAAASVAEAESIVYTEVRVDETWNRVWDSLHVLWLISIATVESPDHTLHRNYCLHRTRLGTLQKRHSHHRCDINHQTDYWMRMLINLLSSELQVEDLSFGVCCNE